MLFIIFDVLRTFEALQIFFYKFLLQWGKHEEDFKSSIFFEAQKYCFVFEWKKNFFFQMVICATLFRRWPTLWKSILKMTTTLSNVQFNIQINNVVSTFLNVVNFNVDVHNVVSTLIWRCVTSRRHINLQTTLSRPWNVCWECSKIVWFIKIHFVICYIWLIIYDWSCNVFCPLVWECSFREQISRAKYFLFTLHEILKFHLISLSGNFVQMHSFKFRGIYTPEIRWSYGVLCILSCW